MPSPYRPAGHRRTSKSRRPDVDQVAVDSAVAGRGAVTLTVPERDQAVAVLTRRGWSIRRIAEHLYVSTRTVARARVRNRRPR